MNERKEPTRVVVCAANRYGDLIITGARHFDKIMVGQMKAIAGEGAGMRRTCEQGFIDQWGVFMDRKEALEVATAAGQIGRYRPKNPGNWLCSEDLY